MKGSVLWTHLMNYIRITTKIFFDFYISYAVMIACLQKI